MPKVTITNSKGLVQAAGDGFNNESALRLGVQTVIATTAGTTTGLISATAGPVVVATSAGAAKIITLPVPTSELIGLSYTVYVSANGCELRTNDPATVSLNGVASSGKELAIPAHGVVQCTLTTTTTWIAQLGGTATPD